MQELLIFDHNNQRALILRLVTYDDYDDLIKNVIVAVLHKYKEVDIAYHDLSKGDNQE